ncbi:hypothetical protein [Streptomyces avicenniae]|uniref:hypothetical protein n=1 Tax=Streptomyces avicenniae TaxID=500153 RepID=UPI00069B9E2C|nr:hypothetical protein [Streptomyces avicenniae]
MAVTPDFHYTRSQIVTEAQTNPWKRQADFDAEVEPDDMAETAARYQRAAAEADDAGELAELASRVGAESGSRDGASLVDDEGLIRMTTAELDTPGVEKVVHGLQKAMNTAIETAERVSTLIHDGGLDHEVGRHSADAVDEWNDCLAQLEAQRPPLGTTYRVPAALPAVFVTDAGGTVPVPPVWAGATFDFQLTQELHDRIRNRHLGKAATTAVRFDGEVRDEIDAYRHRLSGFGRELSDDGYDILGGPFQLLANPEMARYAADGLADELAKKHPDRTRLAEYAAVLATIRERIFAPDDEISGPGDMEDAVRGSLTEQERAYLVEFYGALSPETLSGLGRDLFEEAAGIGGGRYSGWEDDGPSLYATGRDVSNGLLMLMNEGIGGLDLANWMGENGRRDQDLVPEAVGALAPDPGLDRQPVPRASLDASLDFGTLLSTSTVPVGDEFRLRLDALGEETAGRQHDEDSYYGGKYAEWDVSYDRPRGYEPWNDQYRWNTPEQRLAHEYGDPEYLDPQDVPEWQVREGVYGLASLFDRRLPENWEFGRQGG